MSVKENCSGAYYSPSFQLVCGFTGPLQFVFSQLLFRYLKVYENEITLFFFFFFPKNKCINSRQQLIFSLQILLFPLECVGEIVFGFGVYEI